MANKENEEINDWQNEHGEPDFRYLESLAKDGSPLAVEKLKSIALDLDVDFDPEATPADLVDSIRMATQNNEDGNSNDTN